MSALDKILAQPKVTHDLVQGTPEWDNFRLTHRGASEAAAMLGLSKKVTRNELLRMKHSGIAREFSEWVQTRVLDHGHEVEALARPILEAELGEDLYPATCSRGPLSASCDGITLDDRLVMEHKQWNEDLAAMVHAGIVPDEHQPQCQQILLVTGAERVRFVVSDGTEQKRVWADVLPDRAWWERIAAGWEQFDADLAAYTPTEAPAQAVAAPIEALPAVSVRMDGALVVHSNLDAFGTKLRAFISTIPAKPTSDQEFADCDAACKALKKAEDALDGAEANALGQVQSVEKLTRTIADLRAVARTARLASEKVVAARKTQIRTEEVQRGRDALAKFIADLNATIGKPYMPAIAADFAGVISGKKTLESVRNAIDTELARAKIAANEVAGNIVINMRCLRELAADHVFLFADTASLVLKAPDDCRAVVSSRIAEHQAAEARRAAELAERERERIRAEEQAKAEKEARERIAAEQREQEAAQRAQQPQAQQPPAPTQIAAPAPSSKPAAANAPNVVQLSRSAPSLRIGEIGSRLGFGVTEAFLRQLGFPAVAKQGAACLYHEEQFDTICDSLVAHVRMAQERQRELQAA